MGEVKVPLLFLVGNCKDVWWSDQPFDGRFSIWFQAKGNNGHYEDGDGDRWWKTSVKQCLLPSRYSGVFRLLGYVTLGQIQDISGWSFS